MTTHGNVAAHQQERAQGAKGKTFFWGKEFVPESSGAGSLFQSLFWLAKKLYEGQVLDLTKLTTNLSSFGALYGCRDVAVVAVYFLFNRPDEMDISGLYHGLAL
ncbi:hypothetical protein HRG_012464 [Hirsutella rhossiliensis]